MRDTTFFNILYNSANDQDIDLKFIRDTHEHKMTSDKNHDLHKSKFKVTAQVHWFSKGLE